MFLEHRDYTLSKGRSCILRDVYDSYCETPKLLFEPGPRGTQSNTAYGVNKQALAALSENFRDETENKRLGIVIFDEVKLREEVAFNNTSLKVDGFVDFGDMTPEHQKNNLANHALVFMFVPILHRWIQPIAIYASRNATPGELLVKILLQVIINLEQAGERMIGFTSDGSQSNKKVWQILGISEKINSVNSFVPHSVDKSRRLWAFSDAVHIIKCVRNHFHDKVELLFKNRNIDFKYYRRVFALDTSTEFANLRVCPKLTSAHIDPKPFQTINVCLVFQMFSRSVAKGFVF